MPIAVTHTMYECSVCGAEYETEKEAASCERKKVTKDKGVKKGDTIKITNGDGTGKYATVEDIFIYSKYWGHYAWKRYWHTVGLNAKLIDDWGSRQLTFDDYETCSK